MKATRREFVRGIAGSAAVAAIETNSMMGVMALMAGTIASVLGCQASVVSRTVTPPPPILITDNR